MVAELGEVEVYPFSECRGTVEAPECELPVLKCDRCGALNRFYARVCSVCGWKLNNLSLMPEAFLKEVSRKGKALDSALFWWRNILWKLEFREEIELALGWFFPYREEEGVKILSKRYIINNVNNVYDYRGFTTFGINDIFLGLWIGEDFFIYDLPSVVEGYPEKFVIREVLSVSLTQPGKPYRTLRITVRHLEKEPPEFIRKVLLLGEGSGDKVWVNGIWTKVRGEVWEGSEKEYTLQEGEAPILTPFGTFIRYRGGIKVPGHERDYRLNVQKFPIPYNEERIYDPRRNELLPVQYRGESVEIMGYTFNFDAEEGESFIGATINSEADITAVLTTRRLIMRRVRRRAK